MGDCIKPRLDDLGCIELWKRSEVRSCKSDRLIDVDP